MTDTSNGRHERFIQELARAVIEAAPYPPFPAGFELADGEALQLPLATAVGGAGGLKAGIGESFIQEMLGLNGPLLGYLYKGRQLENGVEISADPQGRIECEIGLWLDHSGTITAASPVIEVVRPQFGQESDLTGANLAACNVAADRFLAGPAEPWVGSLGSQPIVLTRNGETIVEASTNDSLGGPEAAAEWMRAETKRRDIELWGDLLFITGTCGSAVPLEAGTYEADFGALGTLAFSALDA